MPKQTIRDILADESTSALTKYRFLTVGDKGLWYFILYEVCSTLLSPIPGAIGILLRRVFISRFFRRRGRGLIIGRSCTIRHPSKISVGDNVTIDDYSLIDGRGTNQEGIRLADGVILNRGTMLMAKGGDVEIGQRSSIGAHSVLMSWAGLKIGDGVLIAGGCSISAGKFDIDDLSVKFIDQTGYSEGPVTIGHNVWIATGSTILDSVQIGDDAVISAGSVVSKNVPNCTVVHGNPAAAIFTRR